MNLTEFAERFDLDLTPRRAIKRARAFAKIDKWTASYGPWWIVRCVARRSRDDVVVRYDIRADGSGTMYAGKRLLVE